VEVYTLEEQYGIPELMILHRPVSISFKVRVIILKKSVRYYS